MKIGQFFKTEGYDLVAKAETNNGFVGVYSNNSSHYLVGSVYHESMADGEGEQARLEASFQHASDDSGAFDDPHAFRVAYLRALNKMVDLVITDVQW